MAVQNDYQTGRRGFVGNGDDRDYRKWRTFLRAAEQKALGFAVVLLAMPAALCLAQDKQALGRELIQKSIEALGGGRFRQLRDVTERGRMFAFTQSELSGLAKGVIYTRYYDPPEQPEPNRLYLRQRQAFGDREDWYILLTNDEGFDVTFRGARPLPADRLERFRTTTLWDAFYLLRIRVNEPGLIIEHDGTDLLDNQPVDVLSIVDSNNESATLFLDRASHLPLRIRYFRRDPATRERFEEVSVYGRFREVGGVQWPHVIDRYRNRRRVFQLNSEAVAVNSGLSESLFTLPASVRILKDH